VIGTIRHIIKNRRHKTFSLRHLTLIPKTHDRFPNNNNLTVNNSVLIFQFINNNNRLTEIIALIYSTIINQTIPIITSSSININSSSSNNI
jgi:hypothetical protein